jgi:hypothetical protein
MVITIGVILAIVVHLKWSNLSIDLHAQAALLATDIRYTQNLSMTQHQKFRLAKISSNTYQIQDGNNNPVTIPSRDTTTTLGRGITFGTLSGITNKIIFDSKGTPYNDATPSVPITNSVIIRLISKGEIVDIIIYPETGRVTP